MHICRRPRRGLSLLELLLASTAMTIIAAALGTLAATIHASNDFCQDQGQGLMHARATALRIQDAVENAQTSESFPGCLVVSTTVAGFTFPETLVVWKPTGAAAAPAGLPRISELVLYTPNPQAPNELWQLTSSLTTTVPPVSDTSGWQTLVANLRSSGSSQKAVLTNRLRTASTDIVAAGATPSTANLRGVIRFRVTVTPSLADVAAYRAGTLTLTSLPWPLDLYGQNAAFRSVACFTEMQLTSDTADNSPDRAFPHFSVATLRYVLTP